MQYITSALKWSEQRWRNTTPCLHANRPFHTIHSHSHLRAHIKPCCEGKTAAQWILCFWIWFIVKLSGRCFHQSLRSLLGSLGVALHTQDLTIQWIAAIFIRFYGEWASTILTTVTLEVEVFVKSHHSDCLLTAWSWNNGLITAHTQRRETPVIILDTVGVVVVISDEGRPLKYARAGAASETMGVETLAHCLKHTVSDPLPTSGTHCQGIHIAFFTLRRTIPVVELHALQGAMAAHATEAVGVEELVHGSHGWLSTG